MSDRVKFKAGALLEAETRHHCGRSTNPAEVKDSDLYVHRNIASEHIKQKLIKTRRGNTQICSKNGRF